MPKMSPEKRAKLQLAALKHYLEHGDKSKAADAVGVSRVTVTQWSRAGQPIEVTKGMTWEEYARRVLNKKGVQEAIVKRETKYMERAGSVLKKAIDAIETALDEERLDLRLSDLSQLLKMQAVIENSDKERKEWMDALMVEVLGVIGDVVSTQQFAVIRTKLLNINREKMETMDLASKSVPSLPIHPEEDRQIVDVRFEDVSN